MTTKSFKSSLQVGLRYPLVRPIVHILCLLPFLQWMLTIFQNRLGPDPAEALAHSTGEWSIYFLMATLAVTPAQQIFKIVILGSYRRMLGLYSFFYASLHLLVFVALFLAWDLSAILEELIERPYITVGMLAFLMLFPLAFTSTNGWRRRLGKTWKKLHKIIYLAASLAVLHVLWQVRSDFGEGLVYLLILGVLLLWRLYRHLLRS